MPVRYIRKDDFDEVVAMERAMAEAMDEDFGCVPKPWKIGEDGLLGIIRQKPHSDGNKDTRTFVVLAGPGEVVGAFAIELYRDRSEVLYVLSKQDARRYVLSQVEDCLMARARAHDTRKSIIVTVPDDDEVMRIDIPFWKEHGYSVKLVPGKYGPMDGWRCEKCLSSS